MGLENMNEITRHAHAHGFTLEMRGSKVMVNEPVPGVFAVTYNGIGHAAFVPEIQKPVTRRVGEGLTVTICVDGRDLGGYDADFRRLWTNWFAQHKGHYHQVPILFRSALVRMGINLVNPLIGNMILALTDPAEYERALQTAVTRAKQTAVQAKTG